MPGAVIATAVKSRKAALHPGIFAMHPFFQGAASPGRKDAI
jgi:hypothetical protein